MIPHVKFSLHVAVIIAIRCHNLRHNSNLDLYSITLIHFNTLIQFSFSNVQTVQAAESVQCGSSTLACAQRLQPLGGTIVPAQGYGLKRELKIREHIMVIMLPLYYSICPCLSI